MSRTKNKVKYNLKNVHFAKATFTDGGGVSFAKPKPIPGAVSLSLDANGEPENFYADGIAYYVINNNMGYKGDLTLALIPEDFRTEILNEQKDEQGVLVENNLLYDTPDVFNIHYGREIVLRNNILALGRGSLFNTGIVEPHVSLYCYGNIFYAGEKGQIVKPWERMRSPEPYEYMFFKKPSKPRQRQDHAIADWNLFYKKGVSRDEGMKHLVDGSENEHSIWADPGFADPENGDFTLKPDSPAHLIGFEPFDTRSAGIRSK